MRTDGIILTELDEFVFIGFSIRKRNVPSIPLHKPGCKVVTMDELLCPPHPLLLDDIALEAAVSKNPADPIIYSFDLVKVIYGRLSANERLEFGLFGYAVELDRIFRHRSHVRLPVSKQPGSFLSYAYAIRAPYEPIGEFKGFDIADSDGELSGLANCGIPWVEAEQCGQLNSSNLFSSYSEALCFRGLADRTVEEHSPFVVWAIFEIVAVSLNTQSPPEPMQSGG
jgi:hypothetical protein